MTTPEGMSEITTVEFVDLKEWMKQQTVLPSISDEELKIFLHSCYYDIKATKDCLIAYFSLRIRSPEIFSDRDIEVVTVDNMSRNAYFRLIPGTANEGYKVIIGGIIHDDTRGFNFAGIVKVAIMAIDMELASQDLHPGYIVVIDCSNFTFGHLRLAHLDTVKKLLAYFQDALPVRLKKLVLINVAPAANMLLNMIRPFMTTKIINLMLKYPRGNTDYKDLFPGDMLPSDFGGTYKSLKEIQDEMREDFRRNKDWFAKEDELIRQLVSVQPQKKNSSLFGLF